MPLARVCVASWGESLVCRGLEGAAHSWQVMKAAQGHWAWGPVGNLMQQWEGEAGPLPAKSWEGLAEGSPMLPGLLPVPLRDMSSFRFRREPSSFLSLLIFNPKLGSCSGQSLKTPCPWLPHAAALVLCGDWGPFSCLL